MNPLLIKSHYAAGEVKPYRVVAFIAGGVATATAATLPVAGVSESLGCDAGDMADVIQSGLAEIEAGAALTAGDPFAADADGRAVKAGKADGETVFVVGFIQSDAAVGDIVPALVVPSLIVG